MIFLHKQKDKELNSGFTIVEAVVVAAIFAVIIVIISSIFIDAMNVQRRAFNKQGVYDDAVGILEKFSRDLLSGRIITGDTNGCISVSTDNFLEFSSWATTPNHIYYKATVNGAGKKKISRGVGLGSNIVFDELSSNKVEMVDLKWCVTRKVTAGVPGQGRVTISGTFRSINMSPAVTYTLQTTVSERIINDYVPTWYTL